MSGEDSTVGKRDEDVLSSVYRQTNVSEMEQGFRTCFLYGWRSRQEQIGMKPTGDENYYS
jgi:hypothetical protein